MTVYLAFLLHIYQPPTQKAKVLKQVIKESYEPLFTTLLNYTSTKLTFNINGSLLELLELYQEEGLLGDIRKAVFSGQIDLVGSSCYHAILPLIPKEEIIRQIELNEKLHDRILGQGAIASHGFWLPEMAYDHRVIEPLVEKNYAWSVLSSVALPTKELPQNFIPTVNGSFSTFFRNDLLSNFISFKHPTVENFFNQMLKGKNVQEDSYVILAMDGETYGHHVKGLVEDFLAPLISKVQDDPDVTFAKIADLPALFKERRAVVPRSSSWSTTEEDIQRGIPFPLWSDPNNHIHNLQLLVMNHTLHLVARAQQYQKLKKFAQEETIQQKFQNSRSWLDRGLHSCQLWWASKRPWYSAEMILKGLNQLILAASEALKVILFTSEKEEEKKKAMAIFDEIFHAQKEIYLTV